ncbi:MAG: LysR family transcriptional regulator [Bacteroidota bacterium]
MNLEWLRTFKAVYKHGNYSKAAEALLMSQPAVSNQMSLLEAAVGHQLFVRKSKGVAPTENATFLNNLVAESLNTLEAVKEHYQRAAQKEEKIYTLGLSEHLYKSLPTHRLMAAFQHLSVRFTHNREQLIQAVVEEQIEAAVVEGDVTNFDVLSQEILDSPLVIVGHPSIDTRTLDKYRSLGDLTEMQHWFEQQTWFAHQGDGNYLESFWRQCFAQRRPKVFTNFLIPNVYFMLQELTQKPGIAIVPLENAKEFLSQHTLKIIWQPDSAPTRGYYLIAHKKQEPFFRALVDQLVAQPQKTIWPKSGSTALANLSLESLNTNNMSFRTEHIMSLSGIDTSGLSKEELSSLFSKYLQHGIHVICFSSYVEGQEPGTIIGAEQIQARIEIIKPYTKWVRTFSCTEGNELIPAIAKENGLKTMVGAWLSEDLELNEQEVTNLIEVAQAGNADLVAVGNEVLYRKEITEEQLLAYIQRVKDAVPGIEVGYVDAYYEFRDRPALAEICDVIYANCYPFWEGCHIDYSLPYMKSMYQIAEKAGKGKRVIVSETGWPSQGTNFKASHPSPENAIRYFINTQKWSQEDDIEVMYFSSFDEAWKVGDEGDVGAYWGLWDKDGRPKFGEL